jgi:Zn-dependent protease with chaperone function
MFVLFGGAIALAAFLVVNLAASVAVAALAPALTRGLAGASPRRRARLLFGLRLFPASVAIGVTAGLVGPAYLLFEPAESGERLTLPLALLALGAMALLVQGPLRGLRALARTAALVRRWMRQGEAVALPGSPVPAYRIHDDVPVFSVVGLRRPRMYVSAQVLDALAPAEVAAAVAHERAHLAASDNVKRLLMRSCPDLLATLGSSPALEREWARAAEEAADEQATGGRRETALALAAGLVKVARIAPAMAAGLPVSALHDGGEVEARVRRLIAASGPDRASHGTGWARWAAATAVLAFGLTFVGHALPAVHRLIEVVARLVR